MGMEQYFQVADMRIVIKKSSYETYWYSKHIGDVFLVEDFCHRDFYVRYNDSLRAILRIDAEFLDKKNPLN